MTSAIEAEELDDKIFIGDPDSFSSQIFQTGFRRDDGVWEFYPDNQLGTFHRLYPMASTNRWLIKTWSEEYEYYDFQGYKTTTTAEE